MRLESLTGATSRKVSLNGGSKEPAGPARDDKRRRSWREASAACPAGHATTALGRMEHARPQPCICGGPGRGLPPAAKRTAAALTGAAAGGDLEHALRVLPAEDDQAAAGAAHRDDAAAGQPHVRVAPPNEVPARHGHGSGAHCMLGALAAWAQGRCQQECWWAAACMGRSRGRVQRQARRTAVFLAWASATVMHVVAQGWRAPHTDPDAEETGGKEGGWAAQAESPKAPLSRRAVLSLAVLQLTSRPRPIGSSCRLHHREWGAEGNGRPGPKATWQLHLTVSCTSAGRLLLPLRLSPFPFPLPDRPCPLTQLCLSSLCLQGG